MIAWVGFGEKALRELAVAQHCASVYLPKAALAKNERRKHSE
jgi:hypothetical protein